MSGPPPTVAHLPSHAILMCPLTSAILPFFFSYTILKHPNHIYRNWVLCMNNDVCTVLELFTQAVSESVMSLFWVHKSVGFGVPGL